MVKISRRGGGAAVRDGKLASADACDGAPSEVDDSRSSPLVRSDGGRVLANEQQCSSGGFPY
jgi:hypothetical protein